MAIIGNYGCRTAQVVSIGLDIVAESIIFLLIFRTQSLLSPTSVYTNRIIKSTAAGCAIQFWSNILSAKYFPLNDYSSTRDWSSTGLKEPMRLFV